ncbi:MAG TPA: DUF4870 domain-containing protein [Pyrinomonadaceae bacterium]|nr:DUF4870 domain-containing protein [Pyrinomonadaceae bacterium]
MQNMSGGQTALGLDLNVGSLVCYLNICIPAGLIYSIIVLATDKTNKLPRFHAFQSIFWLVTLLVTMIPLYIVMIIGVFIDAALGVPLVSGLSSLVMLAIGIGLLVFVIIAAVKAYGGQMYKIPVIGNFADKFSN